MRFVWLFFVVVGVGCSDGPAMLGPDDVLGSYTASAINSWDTGDNVFSASDLGATFTVSLGDHGLLSGHFVAPAAATATFADLDVDLAGTWELKGDSITMHPADSSLFTNATFRWRHRRLTGNVFERHSSATCLCSWWYEIHASREP